MVAHTTFLEVSYFGSFLSYMECTPIMMACNKHCPGPLPTLKARLTYLHNDLVVKMIKSLSVRGL